MSRYIYAHSCRPAHEALHFHISTSCLASSWLLNLVTMATATYMHIYTHWGPMPQMRKAEQLSYRSTIERLAWPEQPIEAWRLELELILQKLIRGLGCKVFEIKWLCHCHLRPLGHAKCPEGVLWHQVITVLRWLGSYRYLKTWLFFEHIKDF